MTDDHETTQLYGADGKVCCEMRTELVTTVLIAVSNIMGDNKLRCMARMFLPSGQHLGDSRVHDTHGSAAQMAAIDECKAWLADNRPGWDVVVDGLLDPPRAEPTITGIWVRPRDRKTGERLAVERDAPDELWRLTYETVFPERIDRVDANQRKVHTEIAITHAELEWLTKLGRANPTAVERRRLPVPPTLEVDDLLDLAARAASAWHAPAGEDVELTAAELHQLGEGAAMEIDRWQREAHAAMQEVRRLSKRIAVYEAPGGGDPTENRVRFLELRLQEEAKRAGEAEVQRDTLRVLDERIAADLAAMSERCHRAELQLRSGLDVIHTGQSLIAHLQRDRRLLEARVLELEADLAATQQARVAEALDRASRTITGRPAAEVNADLTEQLRGDPEPIDGPERFRDGQRCAGKEVL